jgi:hypothetical protein
MRIRCPLTDFDPCDTHTPFLSAHQPRAFRSHPIADPPWRAGPPAAQHIGDEQTIPTDRTDRSTGELKLFRRRQLTVK